MAAKFTRVARVVLGLFFSTLVNEVQHSCGFAGRFSGLLGLLGFFRARTRKYTQKLARFFSTRGKTTLATLVALVNVI
jgi:hypothetical protein